MMDQKQSPGEKKGPLRSEELEAEARQEDALREVALQDRTGDTRMPASEEGTGADAGLHEREEDAVTRNLQNLPPG